MNKTVVSIVVVAVVVIFGWYFFSKPQDTRNMPETYEWQFSELGTDENTAIPRTSVTLLSAGKTYSAGTYDGSCFVIEKSEWTLQEGEKSGVICWWAGGGSEVGVFSEAGKRVVKAGELDEGNAETPGFRGNFQTIFEITAQ